MRKWQIAMRRHSGETGAEIEKKPTRLRARLEKRHLIKIALAVSIGALFFIVINLVPLPSSHQGKFLLGPMLPLIILLAFIIESMDSSTGMGFGTSLSPLLMLLDYEPLAVVPVLLISQAYAGVMTGWFHHEFENIQFSFKPLNRVSLVAITLIIIGAPAILLSVILTYYAIDIPDSFIKVFVAILILLMAIIGIVVRRMKEAPEFKWRRFAFFAVLAGLNKGVGGGGYGPMVTLGELLSGVSPKSAVAITSLAEGIISVVGVVAFLIIMAAGEALDFYLLPSVFLGAFLGAVAAPYLVRVIKSSIWAYIIPIYAIIISILLLLKVLL